MRTLARTLATLAVAGLASCEGSRGAGPDELEPDEVAEPYPAEEHVIVPSEGASQRTAAEEMRVVSPPAPAPGAPAEEGSPEPPPELRVPSDVEQRSPDVRAAEPEEPVPSAEPSPGAMPEAGAPGD